MRRLVPTLALLYAGCADCGRALPIEEVDLGRADLSATPLDAAVLDAANPGQPLDLALVPDAALARAWQPAVPLTAMNPDPAYAPAVAISNAGSALVAWRVNHMGSTGLAAASRFDVASQTWAAEQLLPLSVSFLTTVAVGIDDDGQASAYQCTNGGGELAGFDPMTATWSLQAVPTPDMTIPCAFNVTMPSATSLVALWEPSTGPTASLWAGRYDLFGWKQTAQLDGNSIAVIDGRAISATRSGSAAAIWRGYFPTPQLHASRFDPTTHAWSTPLRLDSGAPVPSGLDIATVPSGDVIAVWDDASVGHVGTIWMRRFDVATGTWSAQQSIGSGGAGPRIAWSASGTAIVVWGPTAPGHQPASDAHIVWTRYDGTSWSTPAPLAVGPGGAGDGHVAINDAGEAVAAWSVRDSMGNPAIWASRFE